MSGTRARPATSAASTKRFCSVRLPAPPTFPRNVSGDRLRLLVENSTRWINGTTLRYAFYSDKTKHAKFVGSKRMREMTRQAFQRWMDVGIGLRFEEAASLADADIRIAFQPGDGHWSYVGRDIRKHRMPVPTMNLDPSDDGMSRDSYAIDTACHEIGHTMGFPHEHQNPVAGIVWNEAAVYKALGAPPNSWPRSVTFANIIEKIPADSVQASRWDPDSVMHYEFEAGLIASPAKYREGLTPKGGISKRDRVWVKKFYPPQRGTPRAGSSRNATSEIDELPMLESRRLRLKRGEEKAFLLEPAETRDYEIRTFGTSDALIVLFESDAKGSERQLAADDDSGDDRNAMLKQRLRKGGRYVVRVRVNYAPRDVEVALMWW